MLHPIIDESENWFDIDDSHKSNVNSYLKYKSSIDSLHKINELGSRYKCNELGNRYKCITKRRKLLKLDLYGNI